MTFLNYHLTNIFLIAETKFSADGGFAGRSYDNQTTVHPIGISILVICCSIILFSKIRYAVIPFIFMSCFVSDAQRIVIAGIDFDFVRILILTGALRTLISGEWKHIKTIPLDFAILAWALSKIFFMTLLWQDPSKLIWILGQTLDTIGGYFIFRCLIRDWTSIHSITYSFALLSIPVALLFLVEYSTARNVFSIFGGVPEITVIRQGKLRCQGAFAHPIIAGSYWAAVIPLLLSMTTGTNRRVLLAMISCFASLVIIATCSSSTPIFGLLLGMIGIIYWFQRRLVYPTLTVIACLIPILHMVMEAPVWHLISRVSAVGGSTSWHRFNLIDQFIRRYNEWFFMGTKSTAHWGHFLFDVANQYVVQGVQGGIVTFILFISVIVLAFKSISQSLRLQDHPNSQDFATWCLGSSLMVHCASFIGLTYFGQATLLLNLNLAMIGSIYALYRSGVDYSQSISDTELPLSVADYS